jgi:molybdopterin-guanine dinucleotide biosynthesis protein A
MPKTDLVIAGQTLLQRTLAAAAGAGRIVVVGPVPSRPLGPGVLRVREDPPFASPAAAVAAGLDALTTAASTPEADWVLVLACDMPSVAIAVDGLVARLKDPSPGDGMIAEDSRGRLQPLAAVYRRSAIEDQVRSRRAAGGLVGASMFALIRGLHLNAVRLADEATDDVDTWQDARRLGVRQPGPPPDHDRAPGVQASARHRKGEEPMADREQEDRELAGWAAEVVQALQIKGLEVDVKKVLGLAGRAAHAVMRPAAPLTTFIAGYAAGLSAGTGTPPEEACAAALETATRLCREHSRPEE